MTSFTSSELLPYVPTYQVSVIVGGTSKIPCIWSLRLNPSITTSSDDTESK